MSRPMRSLFLAFLFACLQRGASAQAGLLPYQDPAVPAAERAADLVGRMTLDEKLTQIMNASAAIPRLGVPAYNWWNEGLHGVARAGYATLFPQAIGMAATWDAPLLHEEGDIVATEARAKNADALRHGNHEIFFGLTFWSPNINIFRDPRWGRGQETYGEDPFLTAQLGVNFVRGLQGDDPAIYKVIATPKHFAVHSGPESSRHRFDVDPSPHDLWDTYLPAFRATIVDAHADSIMCAYNAIEGKPACGSDLLLQTILRGYWNFQGFVTSDCGAVNDFYEPKAHHTSPDRAHADATALLTGTDTECGDAYRGMGDAIQQGLLTQADLDVSLRRLFLARIRLGLFDPPSHSNSYSDIPMSEVDSPAHQAAALKAAEESMVLLKNDGVLPFAAAKYKTMAVIGPNAASLAAIEGNYNAIPLDPKMPVDGLKAQFPTAHILYAQGSPYADGVPVPAPRTLFHPEKGSPLLGLKAEYFNGSDLSAKPVTTRLDPAIDFDWAAASPVPGANLSDFSVRWTGTITAPAPGTYSFSVRIWSCSPCDRSEEYTILVDGRSIANFPAGTNISKQAASAERYTLALADTRPHAFSMTYHHHAPLFGGGLTLNWYPPDDVLQKDAVAAAQKADLVVAMVGLSPQLEGEEMNVHVEGFDGGDRTDIALPAPQEKLLEAVGATGKPLVVVLLNGSSLAVEWAQQHANAVLEAWYPGEAGAEAIAATLAGASNPSGRLPLTFYRSLADLPAFTDYSMRNRTYRYFTGKPLYDFGYGLSYTHFAYSGLRLSAQSLQAGLPLTVEADIANTGTRAGDEVAELYLTPPHDGNGGLSPKVELAGFQRVSLQPGETRHLTFTLNARTLSLVDAQGVRSVQPGSYILSVGGAQPRDPNAPTPAMSATFTITGSQELPR